MNKQLKFPPKIKHLHIPYHAPMGVYEDMLKQLAKFKLPKGISNLEIIHRVYIDFKEPLSHDSSEIILHK